MNNKNTSSMIWSICFSIRGAVSAVDYPYVVLSALLLKWAELKNREEGFSAYKDIYSPARLMATIGSVDKISDIIQYLIDIEQCQDKVNGGYISEVAMFLEKTASLDFSDVLRNINGLDANHSSDLYDFAVEFMKNAQKIYGARAETALATTGVRQIEKIALGKNDDKKTVFDGFAGTGIGIIDVTEGHGILSLTEKNVGFACIAEIMCILKGCRAEIRVGDSMGYANDGKTYDKVIIEPPFGMRKTEYKQMALSYYDPDTDLMCVKYALSKANKNGIAVTLSPPGVLFRSGKTEQGRKDLILNNHIDAVVQLPAGALQGTVVSTAILKLNNKKSDDRILFVDATGLLDAVDKAKSDMVLNPANEKLLDDIIGKRKELDGVSRLVSIDEVADHDFSLVVTQYLKNDTDPIGTIDLEPLTNQYNAIMRQYGLVEKELDALRYKYLV